ncbi:MAG: alpha/beta hydrolase [Leptolyngbya sp. SIO1E4]|nr:alpha/beta hydrolase [Leptolyngbya sp. SIO1E4]
MPFRSIDPKSMRRLLTTAALCLIPGITAAPPARSAETIYFDYGFLGRSLPTSSLEAFVADGTVDAELAPYLAGLSPASQQELQVLLSTPLSSLSSELPEQVNDPFAISQWLYSPIGDLMLATTGQLIQTQGRRNGQQALRSAISLAAADPAGLSLINLIRFYPTGGVRLNLPQIVAVAEAINTNIETTDWLVNAAIQGSEAAAANDPALDYSALPMLAETGQLAVEERSLLLQDRERNRTYPVDLYLPADLSAIAGPVPVLILSHGYGDTHTHPEITAAARSLAANGFFVAAPEHIGSNKAYQDDLALGLTHESFEALEFINRPLDIRFLLNTLEQQNDTEFQGRLQLDRVGLIGHSFGGYTALMAAGATVDINRLQQQCDPETAFAPDNVNIALLIQCRLLELEASPQVIQQLTDGSLADERVGLVITFAPLSNLFGEQGMGQIQVPTVIMGGAYDIATPIVLEQLTAFQWLTTSEKYFYLAENLSHTTELTRAVLDLVYPRGNVVESFNETEQWLFNLTVTLVIAHGHRYLLGNEAYRPYLTSAYVETVSVEPTKLHLLRSSSQLLELDTQR